MKTSQIINYRKLRMEFAARTCGATPYDGVTATLSRLAQLPEHSSAGHTLACWQIHTGSIDTLASTSYTPRHTQPRQQEVRNYPATNRGSGGPGTVVRRLLCTGRCSPRCLGRCTHSQLHVQAEMSERTRRAGRREELT